MKRKSVFLAMVLVLLFSVFASGCSSNKEQNKQQAESPKAVPQEITYNLGTDPETLDPAMGTGMPEATVQSALFEGLVRYNDKKEITPGIAESWTVSPDGKTYTFKLRDSKWSNGDPLTAKDFEYAWKRLLDPQLGAEYAYQMYYVKNAEEYNKGKAKVEDVAIKALDDKTLQVELKAPTPYFVSLGAFANFFPVNKKVVEASKDWYVKPATCVSDGPFKLDTWQRTQKLVMVKNPNYWDAAHVKLDKLTVTMIEDNNTALTMFDTDQIDVAEQAPVKEITRLMAENKVTILPEISTYYYDFNCQKKPFNDVRVRKALTLAVDRKAIVEKVTQAGQKPAHAFTPFGLPDVTPDKDFRQVGGDYFKDDIAEAKKLLAEAGYPDGKGFPATQLIYNTNDLHQKVAEAIQQMWSKNLGVNVTLANQEWKVFIRNRTNGNFDIARAGWLPDYFDPMTFMDIHVTGGGNNDAHWSNTAYDKLIKDAKATGDENIRMKNMHDAEKILMDEMPIAPIFFYVNDNMYKPSVKGVFVPAFGSYQEFKWAYVEK